MPGSCFCAYRVHVLLYHSMLADLTFFFSLVTSSTNGYDGSMMNGLQSLDQWQSSFNHPTGGMLGLLNAIQNIGALAAYPFAPYLSDGIGRRPSIFVGAIIMLGATALQTASSTVNMFIGARFMIGFGLTFAANAAPMLVSEISYPSYRAQLTSVYNSLWYSGAIIAAWATFGTFKIPNSWSWRVPSALQGLPSVAQALLIWFAPESPRYHISKGREAEALRTLAYYHADGNSYVLVFTVSLFSNFNPISNPTDKILSSSMNTKKSRLPSILTVMSTQTSDGSRSSRRQGIEND